ncbi:MAG: TetR family transcriptional regulator [Polyangiaceae bacterium]|nr:TetR family transcriptional regulator [Polyangiaceae bacterium]
MSARMRRREQASEQILEAAAAAIAEHGFHGMSMRVLAQSTGMSLANFYNYFDSKEDLLFALHARSFSALLSAVDAELQKATESEEKLYTFIATHVAYFIQHTAVMHVLVHEAGRLAPKHRPTVRKLKDDYFGRARAIVATILAERGERRGGEIDRATYNVFGMMNWVYAWYDPHMHGSASDVARTIHTMAMRGLAGLNESACIPTTSGKLDAAALPSPIRRKETRPI